MKREQERSEVDLELDFLAPFLAKYSSLEGLTRQQAMKVRLSRELGTFGSFEFFQ